MQLSHAASELIELENKYGAHNYHPLPVVLSKGKGAEVWDINGKKYYDFLSAYSAVNQGHCHPKIIQALKDQAEKLTLTSRAFYSSELGVFEEFVCKTFGLDRMLPMNTGAEAVETAIKLCRKWSYQKKNIERDKAIIVVCDGNFHGRTTTIISFSNDEDARKEYGPYTPGFISVEYNNKEALEKALSNTNVVGLLIEPIQGEAGVIVPDDGYLRHAKKLCEKNDILMIADEVQTGIARTGKLLAVDYEDVKPDILILGKALSGGVFPVSAVLASNDVMMCIHPGQHGSTYGGNPLGCCVAKAAVEVVIEEELTAKSEKMGCIFREGLKSINAPLIGSVRGKGLLNAIDIISDEENKAWDICVKLAENGLLAKPTHDTTIRFSPPLVITEAQINECLNIIESSLNQV